jgi:hypothetical protein
MFSDDFCLYFFADCYKDTLSNKLDNNPLFIPFIEEFKLEAVVIRFIPFDIGVFKSGVSI